MTSEPRDAPQFYLTSPSPCPYLPGRHERKVFTHLVGERAGDLNDLLTHGGFRRSQNLIYRPACDGCAACQSVRIVATEFVASARYRRVQKANADISVEVCQPRATAEQFALFKRYLDARHSGGGMTQMSFVDYEYMVEDTPVQTVLVEYRLNSMPGRPLVIEAAMNGRGVALAKRALAQADIDERWHYYEQLAGVERSRVDSVPAPIIRSGPCGVSRIRSNGSWTWPVSTAATLRPASAAIAASPPIVSRRPSGARSSSGWCAVTSTWVPAGNASIAARVWASAGGRTQPSTHGQRGWARVVVLSGTTAKPGKSSSRSINRSIAW